MNLTKIDSVNTLMTQYGLTNNKVQEKTNSVDYVDLQKKEDYADFSIDYGNEKVSNILNDIKDSFDNSKYMSNNKSIVDCTTQYGKILKSINSNSELDDDTKSQLTKALDKSFDRFAEKKVIEFSSNMSAFFNKPYNEKSIKMGIKGDKLLNQDEAEKNISKMFSAAKTFYKNNLNGTKEQLDTFLEDKFSKTESIDKLSYSDFKSLGKSLDIVNDYDKLPTDIPVSGSTDFFSMRKQIRSNLSKMRSEAMTRGMENLKKEGASSIVINEFEKAVNQNEDSNKRKDAYDSIGDAYTKQLIELSNDREKQRLKLEELEEERKRMIKEYNEQIRKLQEQMKKMAILNMLDGKQDDLIGNLIEIHNKQLESLEKRKIQIQSEMNINDKAYKATSKSRDNFQKSPLEEIDKYIKEEKKNGKNINEKGNLDNKNTSE